MRLLPEIENRYSVRDFLAKPVEEEKLLRVLEAGRRAPSAKNRQPWRFIVTRNEEQRKQFQEAAYGQEWVGQASSIISVCTTNVDYKMPNGELAHPIDLSFAVSFMMIQAQSEGLGTCVITTFREADIREILTVPYSMKVLMLLLVGYPGSAGESAERKDLNQVASFDHW